MDEDPTARCIRGEWIELERVTAREDVRATSIESGNEAAIVEEGKPGDGHRLLGLAGGPERAVRIERRGDRRLEGNAVSAVLPDEVDAARREHRDVLPVARGRDRSRIRRDVARPDRLPVTGRIQMGLALRVDDRE